MDWRLAVLLGVLQGVLEWLPLSSEGALTLVLTGLGEEVGDAVRFSLWLHTGTVVSATVYLRDDLVRMARRVGRARGRGSRTLAFLVVGTVATGLVGGPLLVLGLTDVALAPWLATVGIGVLLLATAAALAWFRPGRRDEDQVEADDGVVAGLVQGLAALPGLSRSGLTMAALFGRGFDAEAALRLSFLLSIPAVAGAQVGLALVDPVAVGPEALLAAAVAAVVGWAAIDGLLRVARRVRFDLVVGGLAAVALVAGAAMWLAG